ncbi:MAG TPA: protein kinase [Polyangiaceae bacterium LLY-WYZ-15_(1-7)]|nr:hypothetical protein [Myxococcales bacterium]MAT29910.1 hypothetical protein [Sandaracinus sp.]MBJ72867.1 hypothetical protein [Sandaracinus sp.]HJL04413.1 protein kinase [Polyangiaceae bacterium LLY-WYZ-15_(1-7)]HJL09035.1 protein kinase [Polyangiaceae bacterium LLY-WYZ-15_(1-7)]
MIPGDPATGDTEVSVRYPLADVAPMLAARRAFLSLEVGAMLGMELAERALEGAHLNPERIWLDIVGHLHVSRRRTGDGGLRMALGLLEDALHPAARGPFRQTVASLGGQATAEDLRERFASILYPIDRASARFTLAQCLERASRRGGTESGPRLSGDGTAPLRPDSLEVVLSGLDDTVLVSRRGLAEIVGSLSGERTRLGPAPTETAPHQLDRFDVFGEIARGGMAQVLLARDPRDESARPCVLKRMLPELAGQEAFRQMFKDEARLGLCLDHPHICRTLAFLEDVGDEPCIQMEWAAGLTVSELLARASRKKQPLPVELVLALGEALASALHYAHEQAKGPDGRALRVVHRDVSPQNVVVQFDGQIKLLDFGVARSAVQTELSVGGQIKGKFAYMSPEQSLGLPLDDRSDVFCVGICLYEALTCRPLFDREDRLATVRALARGEVEEIQNVRGDVPRDVASILRRALASNVEARPHMEELRELVGRARREHGTTLAKKTVRALEPSWRDWRRHLDPFVRELPESQAPGPTRKWKALTQVATGEEEVAEDPTVVAGPSASLREAIAAHSPEPVELAEEDEGAPPAPIMDRSALGDLEPKPSLARGPLLAGAAVALAVFLAIVLWPAEEPEASGSASPPETAAPPSGEERATERGPRVEPLVLPDGPDEAVTEAGGSTEAGGNTEEASGADEEGLAEDGGSAGDEELAEEALAEEGPERDRDEAAAAPEARTETGEEAPIPEGEAALLVQTQPAGARVLLDGEPLVGRTPHRFEDLPAGRHQVTVLLPGHRPVRRWVRLRDGRGGLLRFRLRRR